MIKSCPWALAAPIAPKLYLENRVKKESKFSILCPAKRLREREEEGKRSNVI